MAAYIGATTLAHPLRWIDKDRPKTLGQDIVARDGSVTRIRPAFVSQACLPAEFTFEWETWDTIRDLYAMWLAGGQYAADLEDTGDEITIEFAQEDGVSIPEHEEWGQDLVKADVEGHETDIFKGTLKLWIIDE